MAMPQAPTRKWWLTKPTAAKHQIVTVNYRGESPMWVDVAGGQLQVALAPVSRRSSCAASRPSVTRLLPLPSYPRRADAPQQGIEGRLVTRRAACH
jgi:hypothetical protein